MESSVLLAKLIGPYIILIGVALIFNQKLFRQIMNDFPKNPALVFITGIITFLMGLAIVIFHNIWATDWRVIITFFGWAALLKGALLIIMPGRLLSLRKIYAKNFKLVLIPWAVMLLLGILLTIKGYF